MPIDLGEYELNIDYGTVMFILGILFMVLTIVEKNTYIFLFYIVVALMLMLYKVFWGDRK